MLDRSFLVRTIAIGLMTAITVMAVPAHDEPEIKAVGCYANITSDGEHEDGFSADIWLRGGHLMGFINYHRGLIGDAPMGRMTDISYNSKTGRLSFKAKLSIGLHCCSKHHDVPSHDLLHFEGVLTTDTMKGLIVIESRLDSPHSVIERRDNFTMNRALDYTPNSYRSYKEWSAEWSAIYKRRGPRW